MYTHVLDRWGIFYDQPIVLNERQAGAAIEGVVRQNATKDIAQLAVDTHGYTDFAMGVSRALGFDLCPRLSHLRDRRLHVPRSQAIPARLAGVTDRDVRLGLIVDVWDDFVRIAASIRSGQCTAVEAIARFGSAARGQAVYDGGVQIGRLFRSIFLIDYFTNASFRSELQHALNRGEAVHTVQRAIHIGRIPVELARRQESRGSVIGVDPALEHLDGLEHHPHATSPGEHRLAEGNRSRPSNSGESPPLISRASTCAVPSIFPCHCTQSGSYRASRPTTPFRQPVGAPNDGCTGAAGRGTAHLQRGHVWRCPLLR
jgi:hypothetical protein